MATIGDLTVQVRCRCQINGDAAKWLDLYDDCGEPVTVWQNSAGSGCSSPSTLLHLSMAESNGLRTWTVDSGGIWGVASNEVTAESLNKVRCADSFERVKAGGRWDDFSVPPCDPDEAYTPLVPTDLRVPEPFCIQENFCVRMRLANGKSEDDIELWTAPAGAQDRLRQILFVRPDVESCEVVTLWRRNP